MATTSENRVPLPGSEKAAPHGAQKMGPVDPAEKVYVSVYLRPRKPLADPAALGAHDQQFLSREEFAAEYGADPADISKVTDFASQHGLAVVREDPAHRAVVLAGTAEAMSQAFGVELAEYEHDGTTYRGREGAVTVPADLADVIISVHGLDNRPAAHPHFRACEAGVIAPRVDGGPYSPVEVATAYNFPTTSNGQGQCVAIIELGGGYTATDLTTFFTHAGISPQPSVVSIGVDGATNKPGDPADVEVALDIEVVGAVAPGAKMAVYFGPNTDQGFLDAINAAVHDATNNPSVISISWGSPESNWTAQSLQSFDQAFRAAALMGVTVCCASGDNGSADGVTDGKQHVDFPSSSPNALGCGGTHLSESRGKITNEVVWNEGNGATGGGISDVFGLPRYQTGAHVPPSANPGGRVGRGVPDVSGDAAPSTGYQIFVNGKAMTVGGTSAVSPLWSGLLARINSAKNKPSGLVQTLLYAKPNAFHDITTGNNGAYHAAAGWDPCTGLGTPDGKLVAQVLTPTSTGGSPGPRPTPPPIKNPPTKKLPGRH